MEVTASSLWSGVDLKTLAGLKEDCDSVWHHQLVVYSGVESGCMLWHLATDRPSDRQPVYYTHHHLRGQV